MRIAVCDDCYEDALTLKNALVSDNIMASGFAGALDNADPSKKAAAANNMSERHEVRIYSDAAELLADVEKNNLSYDLYLLDIYMDSKEPGSGGNPMDGIELAKKLRMRDDDVSICFVSTSDGFYREAYNLYAIQYLIKPVDKEELERLIEKVGKRRVLHKEKRLSVKSRGKTGSIPYNKILYISSREHTISVCCTDGAVWEYKGKLDELAVRVCGDIFMRCHQSFLVNMYHVDNLSGNELMISGHRIPVSRRYYTEIKERYQEILFEDMED